MIRYSPARIAATTHAGVLSIRASTARSLFGLRCLSPQSG
jgi:hypothetical protein